MKHQTVTQRAPGASPACTKETATDKDGETSKNPWCCQNNQSRNRQQSSLKPTRGFWSCCPPLLLPASVCLQMCCQLCQHQHRDRTNASEHMAGLSQPGTVSNPSHSAARPQPRSAPSKTSSASLSPQLRDAEPTLRRAPRPPNITAERREPPGSPRRAGTRSPSITSQLEPPQGSRAPLGPQVGCPQAPAQGTQLRAVTSLP